MTGHYGTVRRGEAVRYLSGPWLSKAEAEARVDDIRARAQELDPWVEFDAFGTTRVDALVLPKGILEDMSPVSP